ncbi:hypothetical protein P5673_000815, partial [Acropora cervicornis]
VQYQEFPQFNAFHLWNAQSKLPQLLKDILQWCCNVWKNSMRVAINDESWSYTIGWRREMEGS